MYRHLIVPLDDSPLAVEVAHQAVKLASKLGAKVTFFHAPADYGASSLGALERVLAPAAFNEHVAGEARAILAKAETVARAANVSFDSAMTTSDRPHEAILEVAESRGCDLIFMASHGRRGLKGLILGSQTQKVLQQTTLPVLVAAVESNLPDAALQAPLAIMRDEHRSLAAVIHGLEFVTRRAHKRADPRSILLFRSMLRYIEAFPEALHHPKEDAYLFRMLRERTSDYDATLDELRRQHDEGRVLVGELARGIEAYAADSEAGLARLTAAVEQYASAQMQHMALEYKVIFPAAQRHLTAADWAEIGAAFAANGDPRFSIDNDEEFRQLFARIVNLAHVLVADRHERESA
ncbi:MAG TPA: universal stress protein [Casimicrobiaceae bacterium]|nr:universal stress protein [Casimicrobiaceae bacterium]